MAIAVTPINVVSFQAGMNHRTQTPVFKTFFTDKETKQVYEFVSNKMFSDCENKLCYYAQKLVKTVNEYNGEDEFYIGELRMVNAPKPVQE